MTDEDLVVVIVVGVTIIVGLIFFIAFDRIPYPKRAEWDYSEEPPMFCPVCGKATTIRTLHVDRTSYLQKNHYEVLACYERQVIHCGWHDHFRWRSLDEDLHRTHSSDRYDRHTGLPL